MGFWYSFLAAMHWLAIATVIVQLGLWLGLTWLERRWTAMPGELCALREQIPRGAAVVTAGAVLSTFWLVSSYGRWW